MAATLHPFGDAVVDLGDDDDDDDDDEGEGEGEEVDGEDGNEDEDEEGEGEEELEYYREDGEEDQEDDNDEDSDDEDEDDDDDDEHGGVGEEDEGDGDGEQAAVQDGKVTARAVAMATKSKPAEPGKDGAEPPEESDSEDEMPVNTIGNVPLEWYDDFDHVGYDLDGQKILRGTRKDELDALIARFDDPNASRTVHDYLHGVDVVLSEADIALIKRLQKRRYVDPNMNPYPEMVHYEYADKLHPLSSKLPAKAGFVPSRWEAKQVMRLVMAMRSEQYQKAVENRRKQDAKLRPDYTYLIWDDKGADKVKHHKRLPPPKMPLPGNAESYNPPAEYLFTPEEKAAWEAMDPSDRPSNFVPQQYAALRQVPLYDNLIKERFERCLDLYLCPREIKQRLNIDPDSLLPQLPKPAELRPFPERLSFSFEGHTGRVYSVSVSPTGEHLLTASADGTVRLWEVATARCERTWSLGGEVRCVAFCPNADLDLAAAIVGSQLLLFLPKARPGEPHDKACALLSRSDGGSTGNSTGGWVDTDEALRSEGVMWRVTHVKAASMVTWHHGGDYLASVCPEGATKAVLLHQVSKRSTGSPFAKSKGRIETVAFHPSKCAQPPPKPCLLPPSLASSRQRFRPRAACKPGLGGLCRGREYCSDSTERLRASRADAANPHNSEAEQPALFVVSCQFGSLPSSGRSRSIAAHAVRRPLFFVATQRHVRVYHLLKQELAKKLTPTVKWISSLAVHPGGDNVILGSYDRRVCWFDMDLSASPYKTMVAHALAVRSVAFHPRLPLFASASDDATVHVYHGRVYADLLTNPMLVPLKILKAHTVKDHLGVMSVAFHPTQPWLFSAGADGAVHLFTER